MFLKHSPIHSTSECYCCHISDKAFPIVFGMIPAWICLSSCCQEVSHMPMSLYILQVRGQLTAKFTSYCMFSTGIVFIPKRHLILQSLTVQVFYLRYKESLSTTGIKQKPSCFYKIMTMHWNVKVQLSTDYTCLAFLKICDMAHPEKQKCKNWPQTAAASSRGRKKKKKV